MSDERQFRSLEEFYGKREFWGRSRVLTGSKFKKVRGTKLRVLLTISLLLFALSMNGQSLAQPPKEAHPATAGTGTVLAVQEGPGQVVVPFSPSAPAEKATIAVREKPHEIELTPDGRTAFVTNFGLLEVNHKIGKPGSTISVLDVSSGSVRNEFRLPAGHTAPHGVKLRLPLYNELFTNAEEGAESMVVFHAETGAVLRVFALPQGVHNFVFSPDGTALCDFHHDQYDSETRPTEWSHPGDRNHPFASRSRLECRRQAPHCWRKK